MTALPHTGWQTGFLSVLPVVQTHVQIHFRKMPASQRADALQEAIAAACIGYQRLAVQGKLHAAHPGTLAKYAAKHVRNGRHVGGKQDAARDVMSPACQRRHGVRMSRCESVNWTQLASPGRKTDVPNLACFRIDFARWLQTLGHRDRRIIAALIAGERTSAVSDRFGLTPGRVSQLRRRYECLWQTFQGEPTSKAA